MNEIWIGITKNLLAHLNAAGFIPVEVDDGGDVLNSSDPEAVAKAAAATGEAWVYFVRKGEEGGRRFWVFLVYGNSAWELPADYKISEASAGFAAALEAWSDAVAEDCRFGGVSA